MKARLLNSLRESVKSAEQSFAIGLILFLVGPLVPQLFVWAAERCARSSVNTFGQIYYNYILLFVGISGVWYIASKVAEAVQPGKKLSEEA